MNFPHTITVKRLVASGTQYIYQDLSTIKAFVQPLDINSSNVLNQGFAQSSYAYLPIAADVVQNDRITYDGTLYDVRGVKSYKYGSLTHKKALLEEST